MGEEDAFLNGPKMERVLELGFARSVDTTNVEKWN